MLNVYNNWNFGLQHSVRWKFSSFLSISHLRRLNFISWCDNDVSISGYIFGSLRTSKPLIIYKSIIAQHLWGFMQSKCWSGNNNTWTLHLVNKNALHQNMKGESAFSYLYFDLRFTCCTLSGVLIAKYYPVRCRLGEKWYKWSVLVVILPRLKKLNNV